jgi:hypothetical protein
LGFLNERQRDAGIRQMSVSAREKSPGTGPLPAFPQADPATRDKVSLLFARLTVLPTLIALPYLLVSFPFLLAGYFKPIPVIVLWLLLTAVVVPWGWRRVPSLAGTPDLGTANAERAARARTPRWSLISVAVVAVGFGIFAAAEHSQEIIVMLDPASYMNFAAWISKHGSLPIPQNAADFGGAPGITFNTPAFYQVGSSIVPQFMAGLPMVLSLGYWIEGARLAVFFGPLLGAGAVFTFGGLTARLIGPRWAPFAALVVAVSEPMQFTSRSTLSETLSEILFIGALSLWIDSQRTNRGRVDQRRWTRHWREHLHSKSHVLAFLAGLAFGINLLVRVDAPSDIILLIPYAGLLVIWRYKQALPLIVGTVIGLAYGAVDGVVLTRPYLEANISSVRPLAEAFGALTCLTALAAMLWLLYGDRLLARYGQRLLPLWRRVPDLVTVVPFIVLLAFVARPYVEGSHTWAKLQFAPLSLHWVYWYLGGPVILFAVIGAAILARRCLREQALVWILPLLVFGWTIVLFLYRPAITPHQPWASRRLVPAVEPGLILLAVWLAAWLVRKMRASRFDVPRSLKRVPVVGMAAVCAVALIAPVAQEEFGLNVTDSGKQGVHVAADGLAFKRTYVGEISALNETCAAIPSDSSVLIVDQHLTSQWSELIRGMCGVPTTGYWPAQPTSAMVNTAITDIERTGRRPVVLAATHTELDQLPPGNVRKVTTLYTEIDETLVYSAPHDNVSKRYIIYMWEPNK